MSAETNEFFDPELATDFTPQPRRLSLVPGFKDLAQTHGFDSLSGFSMPVYDETLEGEQVVVGEGNPNHQIPFGD